MTLILNPNNLAKITSFETIGSDYDKSTTVRYLIFEKPSNKAEIHEEAIKLAEHISIIAESRRLINEGKTMTSDEFMNE